MVKKRLIFVLIALFLFLLPLTAGAAGEQRVFDESDLFTASEEASLEEAIAAFREKTGYDFVVLTSENAAWDESLAYADDFYDNNFFGPDTLVYFIDMYNRVPTISTAGNMINVISDYRLETLLDTAYDDLAEGDFALSAEDVLELTEKYCLKGVAEGQYQYDADTGEQLTVRHKRLTLIEAVASLGAGTGVFFLTKKSTASGYTIKGRKISYNAAQNGVCNILSTGDKYLRNSVAVIPRNVDNNNGPRIGGGGFGGGGGSAVHHSSGGFSHGGGSGRRF